MTALVVAAAVAVSVAASAVAVRFLQRRQSAADPQWRTLDPALRALRELGDD